MNMHLSKSRYKRGLHCNKQLWLSTHKYNLGNYEKNFSALIGDFVGIGATEMYQNGKMVDTPFNKHEEAIEQTLELINDIKVGAIFEAAFSFDNINIRVDILERLENNCWGIREVKSSKSIKDSYIHDISIQYFVLKKLNYQISSAQIIYVNGDYLLNNNEIEWNNFFLKSEYKDLIENNIKDIVDNIVFLKNIQTSDLEPNVLPGKTFCGGCEFWDYCTKDKPKDWIANIPRLHKSKKKILEEKNIESISKIPNDFPLTENQQIIVDSFKNNKIFKTKKFYNDFKKFKPPIYFFDFETLSTAVPTVNNTKPFEKIPFQWSLHHLDSNGNVNHWEFLATEKKDYRKDCIEKLINIVSKDSSKIVVYNQSFEKSILKQLGDIFPELVEFTNDIINRVIDLKVFINDNYYHPDFQGSYSLKKVLPALLPKEKKYNEGEVSDGEQAQESFYNLLFVEKNLENKKIITQNLLDYCKKDTESLLLIYQYFEGL